QAMQISEPNLPLRTAGISPWLGTALILLGVVINIASAARHFRLVGELNSGGVEFKQPSTLAIALAAVLAILGLAMAVYLISIRESKPTSREKTQEKSMVSDNGIVTIETQHSVDQAVQKLQGILEAKGVKLFALIDHSGEAEKVGLKMPPTKL